jgi:hypothetical protein
MAVLSTTVSNSAICNPELSLNQSLIALLIWLLVRQLQLAIMIAIISSSNKLSAGEGLAADGRNSRQQNQHHMLTVGMHEHIAKWGRSV